MQNTHKKYFTSTLLAKEEVLIESLNSQPIILVIRLEKDFFQNSIQKKSLFHTIKDLSDAGLIHLEIGWMKHPKWINLILEIKNSFPQIRLGIASINSIQALTEVTKAEVEYSMAAFWDKNLQKKSIDLNQLLIPGVFSPSEFKQAVDFGCQIIKIYPASIVGIDYINQLTITCESMPFIIAAGGLNAKDIEEWINKGYGAITLGRKIINNHLIDSSLKSWLSSKS